MSIFAIIVLSVYAFFFSGIVCINLGFLSGHITKVDGKPRVFETGLPYQIWRAFIWPLIVLDFALESMVEYDRSSSARF